MAYKIKNGKLHKQERAHDPLADKMHAEMAGEFRRLYPGKFTSADVIAFAKARPGSALHECLIVHGGATDAERVQNFEQVAAEVFGQPSLSGRA